MRIFVLLLVLMATYSGYGQSTYYIRADTIRFQKVGGNTVFFLENSSKNKTGAYLRNYNGGRTDFFYAVDSAYISGTDLVLVRGMGTQNLTLSGVGGGNIYTTDGTLTGNRTVNGDGFDLEFSNNSSIDMQSGVSPYSSQIYQNGISVDLSATRSVTAATSDFRVYTDSIKARPHLGRFFIDTLTNSAASKVLHYNPTTGLVSYADTTAAGIAAWGLTGNSGTTPGTNFLGTTDAQDIVFKRNSSEAMRIYGSNKYVGIGTATPVSPLTVKGLTTTAANYGFTQLDASDRVTAQIDNTGRMDLFDFSGQGGVFGLGNQATASPNMPVGHYAFFAKNDAGNNNTTGYIYNHQTAITAAAVSSKLSFGYSDNVNTTGGYSQPNKEMVLSSAGLILPSIRLMGVTAFDAANWAWGGSSKILALGGTTPQTWSNMTGIFEGGGASIFFGTGGDLWNTSNGHFNSGWFRIAAAAASNIGIHSGTVELRVAASAAAGSAITWTNALVANNNGSITMGAYTAGTATFDGSGNITSVSDRRAKNNIKTFKYGLKEILGLKTSTFIYNQDKSNTVMSGFIAQDVQKVMPSAVHVSPNGMLSLETNAIIAALVEAVKEQQKTIEDLQKQVKKLSSK